MERKALESVGAHYYTLRGLLGIPLGIVWVSAGLGNLAWGPFRHIWVFWVALAIALAAAFLILRYYRERYGRITLSRRDQIKAGLLTAAGSLVVWVGIWLDWHRDLPIDGTAAAFGVAMLVYYTATVGLKRHHAVIWGALLVACLVPLWGDVSGDNKINGGLIIMGAVTAVSGLFDHVALKRAFAHV